MIAKHRIYELTATSNTFGYIILHKGILFKDKNRDYVLHMTYSGTEIIPYKTFMKGRKLLKVKEHELKEPVDMSEIALNKKYEAFDIINNNCENFCNDFVNTYTEDKRPRISKQAAIWIAILTTMLITGYLINRK